MRNKIIVFLFSFCFVFNLASQDEMQLKNEYVEQHKHLAIEEMRTYRIPASITLAQGIHESNIGRSRLATVANNHFGIKCHKTWVGETIFHTDDKKGECFRKYESTAQSYRDHSEFLTGRDRYNSLFDLNVKDYKAWAFGLKEAGYATNPKYPELIIKIIDDLSLYEYDVMKGFDPIVAEKNSNVDKTNINKREKFENKHLVGNYRYGYKFPNPTDFAIVAYLESGREVFFNNKSRFVFAKKGDTFNKISDETKQKVSRLRKFNDLKNNNIRAGQMIYIEKKRNKSKTKFYKIKNTDSMYSISQRFGVKLKKLFKKNRIKFGEECEQGAILNLKRKKTI